jgi:RNA polymerase sigma-70 factor (ECF subfamily)
MYGLTNTLEKSTASRAASVYSRPEAMASYARKSNSVKTKTTKDLFWLECVTRIRDQQDQAAFAELFNHFAPRVKSFLMKSGADESLAEECSQEVMVTLWRDQEPDAAEALELQQESTRLAEVIEELPDKQRDIVKRAFYGDLSHQEIAMETGLPLGTIKSRIRLALERMRHSLK